MSIRHQPTSIIPAGALKRCGGFSRFAACDSEPCDAVGPRAHRGLGGLQERSVQRALGLVGEIAVAAGERLDDGLSTDEGIEGDAVGIERVVLEAPAGLRLESFVVCAMVVLHESSEACGGFAGLAPLPRRRRDDGDWSPFVR
jgi:hypothetical protein